MEVIESTSRCEKLEFYPKSRSRVQLDTPARLSHAPVVLDLLPENPPSLDNFVPGANAQALTAVSAWKKARHHEPFLFLWGESGAGKTHLLRACSSHYVDASAAPTCLDWMP